MNNDHQIELYKTLDITARFKVFEQDLLSRIHHRLATFESPLQSAIESTVVGILNDLKNRYK